MEQKIEKEPVKTREKSLIGSIVSKFNYKEERFYKIKLDGPYQFSLVDEAPGEIREFEIKKSMLVGARVKEARIAIPETTLRKYILHQYGEMYAGARVSGSPKFRR